jgi:hypothetical protein
MSLYAGLDISVKTTAICVVNGNGRVLLETMVDSAPDAIAERCASLVSRLSALVWRRSRYRNGSAPGSLLSALQQSVSRPEHARSPFRADQQVSARSVLFMGDLNGPFERPSYL